MLSEVRTIAAERIYFTLSEDTKFQLCNPRDKRFSSKYRLLAGAILEVSAMEERDKDFGNFLMECTGLTQAMMSEIKEAMIHEGWQPSSTSME